MIDPMENSYVSSLSAAGTKRISFYEYFFVLMLMLYAARSNTFFEGISIKDNPVGVTLPAILSAILAFRWRLVFDRQFYLIIFFFGVYWVAVSVKYGVIQPTFLLTYYILFFTTYTAVRTLRTNLFRIYEQILFFFAAISIFFWVIEVGLGDDALFSRFASIPYLPDASFVSGHGINAFIYSIQPYATNLINNATIARNCGFAWEPGSFAVYLCIGIFINLFISKDRSKKIRLWVFLIALLTTQSTTGYAIITIIMLAYLANRDMKRILMLLPVVIPVVILVFSLPFMKDKIVDLVDETSGLDQLLFESFKRPEPATPQRFMSFKIVFVDFLNNPILGLAAHYEDQWTYKLGSNISTISGIGNVMAQFGIIGFLFFIIYSIKSSIFFSKYFRYKGKLLLFIIIILISISYSVIFIPLIMSIWMFTLCEKDLMEELEQEIPGQFALTNV